MSYDHLEDDPRRLGIAARQIAPKIDPVDIPLRRAARFFGAGGICERYEQIEDELWEANRVAKRLADTVEGGYGTVIERFKFSVRAGGFGPAPALRYGRAVHLLDLTAFSTFAPGQYPLRPSVCTVDSIPQAMRARRSIWAHWLLQQGWPVPPEFGRSILIDAELLPNEVSVAPAAMPSGSRTTKNVAAEAECRQWLANLPREPRMTRGAALAAAKKQFQPLSDKAFGRAWYDKASTKGWSKPGRPPVLIT